MAAIELTLSGVLYDKLSRTTRPVVIIGEASYTGLGVGGGPMPPGPGGGDPPHIWDPVFPSNPIPIYPGGSPNPPQLPPGMTPPEPGDPTTPVPPPAGSSGWPVQNMVPPPFIVVNYPGIGPVVVAPPVPGEAK